MKDQEMTNVADVLTRHAADRPWAVAIIEDGTVIHYRLLERLVWAAAWHFRRSGIAPGDVVGLALPHSAIHLVAVYALARIGAASTALPQGDPETLRASLARRFGIKCVVALADGAGPSGVPTVVLTPVALQQAPNAIPAELRAVGGDAPWSIRRTSGTTGEAKGVARTHRNAGANFAAHAVIHPRVGDRLLAVLDLAMAYGQGVCERTLYGGGTVVISPMTISPSAFLEAIDRFAITHVSLTGNFFSALLPFLPTDACRCPGLVEVTTSGMAMPEQLRAEIRRRFSPHLVIWYGANEAQTLTAADAAMQREFPETVGRALPEVEIQIVDDDDRPVEPGEPGLVRARTPWMPKGYFNAPDSRGRTFRNGWMYPGDIGVLSPEGMLFLRGRADDMMNYDGIKIMPADIEEVLLAHPAVAEAVAFPVASSLHQHLPAAAVVLRHPVASDELLAYCRQRLGVRTPLAIGVEADFPRNAAGKVMRQELAAKLAAVMPPSLR
ncbi:MAG: class I adenylate-forming enzyme family protein [Reyranellaceae bacterium]